MLPVMAQPPSRSGLPAALRAVGAVLRRELTEALREPHVLAFSLGFPLLFYPLLIWGSVQLAMLQDGALEWSPPRVAVVVDGAPIEEVSALERGLSKAIFEDAGLARAEADSVAALDDEAAGVDVWVEAVASGPSWQATVHHLSTRSRSAAGARAVEEALEDLAETREGALVERVGADPSALEVWSWEAEDVSPRGKLLGRLLGLVLPVVLLSAMMVAGIYPAVEIVVGEKERRTLETTLTSAVSRVSIVVGKVLALLALIGLSVVGNLGAMVLTMVHILATSGSGGASLELSLEPGSLALAAGMLLVQAVLLAAVLVLVCLPAQTFKQGQTVASLVSTLGMLPAMVAMLPTAELSWGMALVPVSNTALVVREAVGGEGSAPGPLALALVLNLGLAVGLFALALRLVRKEQTWFGGGRSRVARWIARLSGEGSG